MSSRCAPTNVTNLGVDEWPHPFHNDTGHVTSCIPHRNLPSSSSPSSKQQNKLPPHLKHGGIEWELNRNDRRNIELGAFIEVTANGAHIRMVWPPLHLDIDFVSSSWSKTAKTSKSVTSSASSAPLSVFVSARRGAGTDSPLGCAALQLPRAAGMDPYDDGVWFRVDAACLEAIVRVRLQSLVDALRSNVADGVTVCQRWQVVIGYASGSITVAVGYLVDQSSGREGSDGDGDGESDGDGKTTETRKKTTSKAKTKRGLRLHLIRSLPCMDDDVHEDGVCGCDINRGRLYTSGIASPASRRRFRTAIHVGNTGMRSCDGFVDDAETSSSTQGSGDGYTAYASKDSHFNVAVWQTSLVWTVATYATQYSATVLARRVALNDARCDMAATRCHACGATDVVTQHCPGCRNASACAACACSGWFIGPDHSPLCSVNLTVCAVDMPVACATCERYVLRPVAACTRCKTAAFCSWKCQQRASASPHGDVCWRPKRGLLSTGDH